MCCFSCYKVDEFICVDYEVYQQLQVRNRLSYYEKEMEGKGGVDILFNEV